MRNAIKSILLWFFGSSFKLSSSSFFFLKKYEEFININVLKYFKFLVVIRINKKKGIKYSKMMNPLNIKCKKCLKSFDRGEQMSLYNNNYYHNTCFVCNFCEGSLAGQGFFTKPDGSFQCQRCHQYHTPKCFICNNPIPDGVKVFCLF